MKPAEFFAFSIGCENHRWINENGIWKEMCDLTGKSCETVETCPEVDDGK